MASPVIDRYNYIYIYIPEKSCLLQGLSWLAPARQLILSSMRITRPCLIIRDFGKHKTPKVLHFSALINPRRACARVTVVVVSVCVCVCVCLLSHISL